MAEDPKTTADLTYNQYNALRDVPEDRDIPNDDIKDVNTQTTQSISREPDAVDIDFYRHADVNDQVEQDKITTHAKPSYEDVLPTVAGEEDEDYLHEADIEHIEDIEDTDEDESELEDIPDADDIQENSPVDPSAPPLEDMHGTDLINGFNGEDPEEG
ncbi:hypothetical protein [Paenibacillus pini]|uniref:Uncharacterized protein n=1 Tax=Paenibacillus pini JCM 16418 TaxID=1236976 RepID=W7YVH9_9BACL|nr:hypothetical protein [Paenibacillus pini]GAF08581.1 hypothetical protein JCM16418_2665 [Paenibacillus pini JCM 16418]